MAGDLEPGIALPELRPNAAMPKIAAQAHDLEAIKRAVEDAASVSGGLWLSYLFVLFYLAVAAGAVTHADLFLENAVELPFLGIKLQLKAFFFLAPLIFCVTHAYTLVYFVIFSDKAKWYHSELESQITPGPDAGGNAVAQTDDIRSRLRRQLPSNIFVQFLAGPRDIRDSWFGFLLKCIAWTSLVIAPILLLLLIQLQFLPYHARMITWVDRLALLFDLILVWWLWHQILLGRGQFRRKRTVTSYVALASGIILSASAIVFSWAIATFPGEWQEEALSGWRPFSVKNDNNQIVKVSLHDAIFARRVDPTTRRRVLSSTLVLPVFNIYEALKIDDPKKAETRKYLFSARGRDLRGAVFDLSNLSKVDFEGAFMQKASLDRAKLQNASLFCAHLQGASLYRAQIQGTSLIAANLNGAELQYAEAQGAVFVWAQLQGAELGKAGLEGATFDSANLGGASLASAGLRGATFKPKKIPQPACFDQSVTDGLKHKGADLEGAVLGHADVRGTSFAGAQLEGASFHDATIDNTDLSNSFLWRTDLAAEDGSTAHVRLSGAIWDPRIGDSDGGKPWTAAAYADRAKSAKTAIPSAKADHQALTRLHTLDCAAFNKTRASCGPDVSVPHAVSEIRTGLEARADDGAVHQKALAGVLSDLVCSGDPNAIFVMRGLVENGRIRDTGAEAPALIDSFLQSQCLVSTALDDDDKTSLIAAKRAILAKAAK